MDVTAFRRQAIVCVCVVAMNEAGRSSFACLISVSVSETSKHGENDRWKENRELMKKQS